MAQHSKPCNDCPFRPQALGGWLGTFNAPQEMLQAAMQETPFSCHKATDNKTLFDGDHPPCVGRMLFATRHGKMFRDAKLEQLRREIALNGNVNDVMGLKEFVDHHTVLCAL